MTDQAAQDRTPVIVTLPVEIDVANVAEVYDLLSAAVGVQAPVVVADLTATGFCDAAGVRLLVKMRGDAAARGSQLRLVIPAGALLRRLLVVLGADHQLPVYASIEEASQLIAAPQHPFVGLRPPGARPPTGRRPEDVA